MRELLGALAAAPGRPRPFPEIEDELGWPRRRIASVLGGVARLRHMEFGGRRPYRFHDERQAASGRWELWMDAEQARAVRAAERPSTPRHTRPRSVSAAAVPSCVERVWDYPRPPAVVPCERRVRVELGGVLLADSARALRVLETSHPPTVYVPPEDVRGDLLAASGEPGAACEFKGLARYVDATVAGRRVPVSAGATPAPAPGYEALRDHVAFYPGASTPPGSATSACRRRPATSTAAGSPRTSSAPSRGRRARSAGRDRRRPRAGRDQPPPAISSKMRVTTIGSTGSVSAAPIERASGQPARSMRAPAAAAS